MIPVEKLPEKDHSPSFFSKLLRQVDGCELKLIFADKPNSSMVTISDTFKKTCEKMHLYSWKDSVRGSVVLTPIGSSYRHKGVLIEFIGTISTISDVENRQVFLRQQRYFEPDTITQPTPFEFNFSGSKEYESYHGINAKVSYYLRATVQRTVKNITEMEEIWVTRIEEHLSGSQPDISGKLNYFRETVFGPQSTTMEVGVENLLQIEFRYNKQVFHLSERILGKVTFKISNMDIQFGEISILRKEFVGSGLSTDSIESETLQRYEIMDGTPIVGEVVPIRLYLNSVPRLTPTYANVGSQFRVLYFLDLMFMARDGKRYYKQQEITLYRCKGQDAILGLR